MQLYEHYVPSQTCKAVYIIQQYTAYSCMRHISAFSYIRIHYASAYIIYTYIATCVIQLHVLYNCMCYIAACVIQLLVLYSCVCRVATCVIQLHVLYSCMCYMAACVIWLHVSHTTARTVSSLLCVTVCVLLCSSRNACTHSLWQQGLALSYTFFWFMGPVINNNFYTYLVINFGNSVE